MKKLISTLCVVLMIFAAKAPSLYGSCGAPCGEPCQTTYCDAPCAAPCAPYAPYAPCDAPCAPCAPAAGTCCGTSWIPLIVAAGAIAVGVAFVVSHNRGHHGH